MTLFALFSAACSSSDDEGGDTPGGTNPPGGGNTGYIATNAVKTLKMVSGGRYAFDIIDKMYLIYEDYTYRYYLGCAGGSVRLYPYERSNGEYVTAHVYYDKDYNSIAYGIKAFPKVSNLQMLTDRQKTEAMEGCRHMQTNFEYIWASYATFAPGCGFVAWFKTETEEARYVRIRSTNYTLDEAGSLASVSIEYQLF